jgi:hypothetical protein
MLIPRRKLITGAAAMAAYAALPVNPAAAGPVLVASTAFQTPTGGGSGGSPAVSNANGGSAINTTGANFLALIVNGGYSGLINAVSDTIGGGASGNTWNHLTAYTSISNPDLAQIWYSQNPAVGANHVVTITFTASGAYNTFEFWAFSGMLTASVFDQENGHNQASGPTNSGSITPSLSGELIITAGSYCDATSGASVSGGSFSAPAGAYINGLGNAYGGFAAYLVQGAASAINPQWAAGSGGTTANRSAAVASFKASGGVAGSAAQVISQVIN